MCGSYLSNMHHWYALQTEAKREREVLRRLIDQEFETFLPVAMDIRASKGIVRRRRVPLFPRYVFVRFDITVSGWQSTRYTRGVRRLIGIGDKPSPIRDVVINDLRERSRQEDLILGQRVKVIGGYFDGVEGLLSYNDGERVRVLFKLLGTTVEPFIPVQHIKAL